MSAAAILSDRPANVDAELSAQVTPEKLTVTASTERDLRVKKAMAWRDYYDGTRGFVSAAVIEQCRQEIGHSNFVMILIKLARAGRLRPRTLASAVETAWFLEPKGSTVLAADWFELFNLHHAASPRHWLLQSKLPASF